VPARLSMTLAPERLDEGSSEERSAFGLLTIRIGDQILTEGFDAWINGYRTGPLISGYHLAEWLAWNWWRLRWEPRSLSWAWWRAHKMTSIGEGYIWPNITIFSDGLRTAMISHPSSRTDAKPFRYVGSNACIIPSSDFEAAVDAFIPQILGRLRDTGIPTTNLDRIWSDVLAERSDPEIALRRKFEAFLGADPDDYDTKIIEQLVEDANALGKDSMGEIAADHTPGRAILGADALRRIATTAGFDLSGEVRRLQSGTLPSANARSPAWLLGAQAAQAYREQLHLEMVPISDVSLANLAGVSPEALELPNKGADLSFILNEGKRGGRIVLRSKWRTGRRFELARLLGDCLMHPPNSRLFPATRSHTFRQKAQRSFAAELLAPFDEVVVRLDGDYSEESRQDVAEYFQVSELEIRTLLINHHKLEREDADEELDISAA
jgi:hypothetical protein